MIVLKHLFKFLSFGYFTPSSCVEFYQEFFFKTSAIHCRITTYPKASDKQAQIDMHFVFNS
jgi:hypothetical protein